MSHLCALSLSLLHLALPLLGAREEPTAPLAVASTVVLQAGDRWDGTCGLETTASSERLCDAGAGAAEGEAATGWGA